MSKKDKKAAKQQARRLQELKRQQEQQKMMEQLQRIKQQQKIMRQASSPLVQYGLLDAYEFFLKHLAQCGIPQPNIFEFAAQAVLRYQKRTKRKDEQLKRIQDYNKSVVQNQLRNSRQQSKSTKKKLPIRPNMLPFKNDINNQQLDILSRLNSKNVDKKQPNQNQNYSLNEIDNNKGTQ